MKPPKQFDCVQMKWQIQEQLANEFADVSEEEAQRRLNERVMTDPILGPFLKRVQDVSRAGKSYGVGKHPYGCPPSCDSSIETPSSTECPKRRFVKASF